MDFVRKLAGIVIWPTVTEVKNPITQNRTYNARCNSFILQNAGNTTVTLANGWTMKPGAILNSHNDLPAFEKSSFLVKFSNDAPAGDQAINRLEIIEKRITLPEFWEWCKNICKF